MTKAKLDIAFFGSSLLSAYWNGAATYYRGIIKALWARGHHVTFYEPDAYGRQQHRDIEVPAWADVIVYSAADERDVWACLESARDADVIVKASGVGVFDDLLEEAVLTVRRARSLAVYWDVDAPATLARLNSSPGDRLKALVPKYDLVLTYGGGAPVVRGYRALGARDCVPIYNALDPSTHHPVDPDPRFACDLAFLGNRLPDREARVTQFFFEPAQRLPNRQFLLGGSGWEDKQLPPNVRNIGHVYTRDHNALNSTAGMILNISRADMAALGFSPATRVFEAAGAGACIITDAWDGIEQFLEPGREILVAEDGGRVGAFLADIPPGRAAMIGAAARRRILAAHTYAHRAALVETLLLGRSATEVRA